MEDLSLLQFTIGLAGLVIWGYVIVCLYFKQIVVDRILSRGRYWHIAVIFMLVALVPFALGAVAHICGLHNYDLLFNSYIYAPDDIPMIEARRAEGFQESPGLLSAILYQFRGLGGHFYAGTDQGRIWAVIIGVLGTVLFSGLLIPSVLSIIRMRSDNFNYGNARYTIQRSPYAVILGAHDAVPELIHQILSPTRRQRIKYVILQTPQNVFYYRMSLRNRISVSEEFHTILYASGRSTRQHIEPLHLEHAKEVYVLGEAKESDADHDSLNLQCLRTIAQLLKEKKRKERLQCYVLFEHQSTFAAFQHSDLTETVKDQIEFISLNLYEMWAQNVLSQTRALNGIQYLPLEGGERLDATSEKHVHLIVVGMSRMGVALAQQAAHICHFPNYVTKGIRTRITFIDAAAEKEKDVFIDRQESLFQLSRWRLVDPAKIEEGKTYDDVSWKVPATDEGRDTDFLDVEWEFVAGRLESPAVRAWLCNAVANPSAITTVAICFHKAQESQTAAIYLPTDVYRHAQQVLVYQRLSSEIVTGLAGFGKPEESRARMRYQKLRPFGMMDSCFSKSIVDYRLAKLVNYVYWRPEDTSMQHVNDPDPEHGKLPLQESFWRQCAVADQWSSNYNAGAVATKLRFLGLDILKTPIAEIEAIFSDEATVDMLAKVEHNRWNMEKLLNGYRWLTPAEWNLFAQYRADGMPYKQYAKEKKMLRSGWEMAHLDICSMKDLTVVDEPSIAYDIILTKAFPAIVRTLREEERMGTH